MRSAIIAFALILQALGPAVAADDVTVEITGRPSIVFDTVKDGCEAIDVPDVNARAFRAADGQIVMFALHYVNRPLRGPDFDHLKIDCHPALGSPLDPEPAHYADRNFVAATWTRDGRDVAALVHEEYHADDFGRCRVSDSLGCWYNTVLAYRSSDGGLDLVRSGAGIVAAAPFRQDVDQGRHRGFFNPSNMFADGGHVYAFISTTGWDGQPYGNCLFRSDTPADARSWRAFDGKAFTIRYGDPYKPGATPPNRCATIDPFAYAVGSVVRHRPTGTWIAVFQASAGSGAFPLDGFYYATSRDLLHWSAPKILLAGRTLYGDLCKAGPSIVNYPSMIDPASPSRNFDVVGDHPDLFFMRADVANCQTGARMIVREGLTIRRSARS